MGNDIFPNMSDGKIYIRKSNNIIKCGNYQFTIYINLNEKINGEPIHVTIIVVSDIYDQYHFFPHITFCNIFHYGYKITSISKKNLSKPKEQKREFWVSNDNIKLYDLNFEEIKYICDPIINNYYIVNKIYTY